MNIVLNVTFTGAADQEDILAARRLIRLENDRRTAENVRLAALVPPGTPLALLPFATGAELKASVLSLLTEIVVNAWKSYIDQGKAETTRFTKAQLDQVLANLNARLNAGESVAAIVSDTAG